MGLDICITDQDLPVLSAVATQALELLQDPLVTNRRIEELIRQDPALTERLLRTANSPFYAGRNQSSTISDAILRLGLRQLRNVIIVAATGELFSDNDPMIQSFWDHSIASAMTANLLSELLHSPHHEESFIAGMLHDVGELIIYRQHSELYREMLEEVKATGRPLQELENEKFQYFTHMSVGGLVVRKWRLSDSIAEAARFHHDLESEIPSALQYKTQACIASVADVVIGNLGLGMPVRSWEEIPTLACAQYLHLSAAHVTVLKDRLPGLLEAQLSVSH